jgi:hypothetical protein
MNDTFAARVELYSEWDRQLHSRTRFFGAAALVNAALAELWPRCALARFAYRPGLTFLATLGEYFQTFKIAVAWVSYLVPAPHRWLRSIDFGLGEPALARVALDWCASQPPWR